MVTDKDNNRGCNYLLVEVEVVEVLLQVHVASFEVYLLYVINLLSFAMLRHLHVTVIIVLLVDFRVVVTP